MLLPAFRAPRRTGMSLTAIWFPMAVFEDGAAAPSPLLAVESV